MTVTSLRSRLVLAIGLALIGGLFAFLIQRSTDTAPESAADGTAYLDGDLVGRIPGTASPKPSESPEPNSARTPRRVGVQSPPQPAAANPSPIENLPAAPEQPDTVDTPSCQGAGGLPGLDACD